QALAAPAGPLSPNPLSPTALATEHTDDGDPSPSAYAELMAIPAVARLLDDAFANAGGTATSSGPVPVGRAFATISVGALRNADLACLVLRMVGRHTAAAPVAAPAGSQDTLPSPLEEAVAQAKRLLAEASVLVRLQSGPPRPQEFALGEETLQFFRAVLLLIGARVAEGATITVARQGAGYAIALEPPAPSVLADVAQSQRLVMRGLEAGLAIAPSDCGALLLSPLVPERSGEDTPA
ncbi:MAG: hypothetical protein AAGF49_13735, partial [Pseudomonadota bacterium]